METETEKKPIKRNPNLVPLSREHHFGLLFAWKLKQGLAKNASPEIMRDYVIYFWENGLREHFKAEEAMLLDILPETDDMQKQLLQEHAQVQQYINQITKTEMPAAEQFENLHTLLTSHIRFEERSFFPHLEANATEEELEKIGDFLKEEHAEPEDTFQPEFWVTKKIKAAMQITPQTKISVILKANPKAVDAIASINPHFEKLRNPILRKILASRVSIADAARIGNASVADFFEKLQPLGFESGNNFSAEAKQNSTLNAGKPNLEKPADLPAKLVELDVRESLANGSDPFNEIMNAVKNLASGRALCLINTFEPTPLIVILKKRGYFSFVETLSPDLVHTYFWKTVADSAENPTLETTPEPDSNFETNREKYGNHLKEIDVRDLEMPLPMTTILETLPTLKPDEALFVIHRKVPQFLLPQLADRGFGYAIQEVAEGHVHLLLYPLHHGRTH